MTPTARLASGGAHMVLPAQADGERLPDVGEGRGGVPIGLLRFVLVAAALSYVLNWGG